MEWAIYLLWDSLPKLNRLNIVILSSHSLISIHRYETAWSPAVTILTKLSNLVPNCLLTLEYEEETGWGGEYEILRGEVKELVSYENRCYACQSFDTLDYCEDGCGEFCSECHEGSWRDEEAMAECQDHKIYLSKEHVPQLQTGENK